MFKKKKMKTPFVVILSFSRRSIAEIAKNTLSDKQILESRLLREKSKLSSDDYTFFNFVDDDNKVFRVIFQVVMKEKEKFKKKLFTELKCMFDCSDVEIVNKQDFDFTKYNLNPLLRSEMNNNLKVEEKNSSNNNNNTNTNVNNNINNNNNVYNNSHSDEPNITTLANEKFISKSLESNFDYDNKQNYYSQVPQNNFQNNQNNLSLKEPNYPMNNNPNAFQNQKSYWSGNNNSNNNNSQNNNFPNNSQQDNTNYARYNKDNHYE